MTTQGEALEAAGKALYGEDWIVPMAADIQATEEEIRDYLDGSKTIGESDWSEIYNALVAHILACQSAKELVAKMRWPAISS